MLIDRAAFMVVNAAGVPKTDALPPLTLYRSRAQVDLAKPVTTVPHLGGGLYGFTAPASDVAAGVAYLVELPAGSFNAQGGTRVFGTMCRPNAPFFAQLFETAAGGLWAGAAATLPIWNDFAGGPSAAPAVTPIAGPHFLGFSPTTADLLAGRVFRWDAPAGAYPQYPHGVVFYGSGAPPELLGDALLAQLAADPDLVALVGDRMFPNLVPQGQAMPALVYSIISTAPGNTLDGNAEERLDTVRLQIDCWAKTYRQAHLLDKLVDRVLANLVLPEISAWREGSRDLYDNQTQRHRVSTDYLVQRGEQ